MNIKDVGRTTRAGSCSGQCGASRPQCPRQLTRAVAAAAALLALLCAAPPGVAQTTAGGDAQKGAPASTTASPPATPQTTRAEAERDQQLIEAQALRKRLTLEFGYQDAALDHVGTLIDAIAHDEAHRAVVVEAAADARTEAKALEPALKILGDQLKNPSLRRRVRRILLIDLARVHTSHAAATARYQATLAVARDLGTERELVERQLKLVMAQHEADYKKIVEEERKAKEAREREERERLAKAAAQERDAQERLRLAREREAAAKDAKVKELLKRERELAEQMLDQARRKTAAVKTISKAETEAEEAFASARQQLNSSIEKLPALPKPAQVQDLIDPLFIKARAARDAARASIVKARDASSAAEAEAQRARDDAEKARNIRNASRESLAKLGNTELDRLQLSLDEQRLTKATGEQELAEGQAKHLKKMLELERERLLFYDEKVEQLLPRISDAQRARFYALLDQENWREAREGVGFALARSVLHVARRLEQLVALPGKLGEWSAWVWISGLVLRLLFGMTLLFVARSRGQRLVKRLVDRLLKRPLFRERPSAAIKIGEVVRHVLVPVAMFASITLVLHYGHSLLSELRYVQWAVNAWFVFWITNITVKVVVLPRAARRGLLTRIWPFSRAQDEPEEQDDEQADLFVIEHRRARKLVRSITIIHAFWLIDLYIPDAVEAWMGHSVIWKVVDLASTWGFIFVVYSVLSTWKDDIARGFEEIAAKIMPRAVAFVNTNKDRPWGVLVIGAASIYVIIVRGAELGRRFITSTEWSKRINNFIFRKKIEYQQRERERAAVEDDADESVLPPGYAGFYEDVPLVEEPYLVERREHLDAIFRHYIAWNRHRRQGSVALIGETGSGKTTSLNQLTSIFEAIFAEDDKRASEALRSERASGQHTSMEAHLSQTLGVALDADGEPLLEEEAEEAHEVDGVAPGEQETSQEQEVDETPHVEGEVSEAPVEAPERAEQPAETPAEQPAETSADERPRRKKRRPRPDAETSAEMTAEVATAEEGAAEQGAAEEGAETPAPKKPSARANKKRRPRTPPKAEDAAPSAREDNPAPAPEEAPPAVPSAPELPSSTETPDAAKPAAPDLLDLLAACHDHDQPPRLVYQSLDDKLCEARDVVRLLRELFALPRLPVNKREAIALIMEQPPHLLVLDDCHHLFLRRIGGFSGLEFFLEIVNLTDSRHFWVLSFNHLAWSYLNRVRKRAHYFGQCVRVKPWSEAEIKELIWTRTMLAGVTPNFTNLVVTRADGEELSYEVVKTARGYFRLLHEFTQGNPRVAITYWLRSLKPNPEDAEGALQVGLFRQPPPRLQGMADNYWFALTAIIQHGALNAEEISLIANADVGFCAMALNYFEEMQIVVRRHDGRANVSSLYFRQVFKHLTDSNYLYE